MKSLSVPSLTFPILFRFHLPYPVCEYVSPLSLSPQDDVLTPIPSNPRLKPLALDPFFSQRENRLSALS